MRKLITFACIAVCLVSCKSGEDNHFGLTLVPYGTVTDKITMDLRAGIVNNTPRDVAYEISLLINDECVGTRTVEIKKGESYLYKLPFATAGLNGEYTATMKVTRGGNDIYSESRNFEVVPSDIRSDRRIDGAWCGIYHWSEEEGLHWNKDIKQLTDDQWKELVRAMHNLKMDAVVIQEVFRNQEYVGMHSLTADNYQGRAFYPSDLYTGRMAIVAKDPVEAILSQADELGMNVMMGVGMFAWFDFTAESLAWHKKVARELWDKYGHHKSFYAFYISEECAGNLFNGESELERIKMRKQEIVDFFREMKAFCAEFAPEKPLMLATNSMGIMDGLDTYPSLLENLDILCPFGFARMPEGDLTGKEAADLLQSLCSEAGSHLWFDLEAFLFNEDMSLYPKPIEQIVHELTLLDNFEKVLCYQFPGVFNSPEMSFRVGEERTIQLYEDYSEYLNQLTNN